MKKEELVMGGAIAVIVDILWFVIFTYYSRQTSYIGMAILPAIFVGLILFVASFFLSIFIHRRLTKE